MTGNFQPANGVTFADEADNSGELDLSASPETNLYGEFVYKAQDKTVKNRGGNLCGLWQKLVKTKHFISYSDLKAFRLVDPAFEFVFCC